MVFVFAVVVAAIRERRWRWRLGVVVGERRVERCATGARDHESRLHGDRTGGVGWVCWTMAEFWGCE
jgi:hypothetical protein